MKYILCIIFIASLFSFDVYSQNKEKEKEEIIVITKKTDEPLILYHINDKYYLGDTEKIIIPLMDASKIISIKKITDKNLKLEYSKKTGKFSEKVSEVFVIETKENFEYKEE
jgi:hypothetical protein